MKYEALLNNFQIVIFPSSTVGEHESVDVEKPSGADVSSSAVAVAKSPFTLEKEFLMQLALEERDHRRP
ncbi:hypothetical protein M378DRAFT_163102, partial [Amanita muscaria Koide BX008]